MRAIILILIIAILVVIGLMLVGFIDIRQIRGAEAPHVSTTGNGVTAKGGQAPAFDVQTGSVKVGSTEKTVRVPALRVEPPSNEAAAANTSTAQQ